jgi:hypothetical protein
VMGAQNRRVKEINVGPDVKINYPEDVVLRFRRSTGCRRSSRSEELSKCSIC